MKKNIGKLLALVLLLSLCGSCGNGDKETYERFHWGSDQESVSKELNSLGIDYDFNFQDKTIFYVEENFRGIEGLDAGVRLYFADSDSLEKVGVTAFCSGNEEINKLVEALKSKYGKPDEESNDSEAGLRLISMTWSTSTSNIDFGGLSTAYILTLTPKE